MMWSQKVNKLLFLDGKVYAVLFRARILKNEENFTCFLFTISLRVTHAYYKTQYHVMPSERKTVQYFVLVS